MQVKIKLEKGETLLQAETKLAKALKAKTECSGGERYCDPAVNEFYDSVASDHEKLVTSIIDEIKEEIERDVNNVSFK